MMTNDEALAHWGQAVWDQEFNWTGPMPPTALRDLMDGGADLPEGRERVLKVSPEGGGQWLVLTPQAAGVWDDMLDMDLSEPELNWTAWAGHAPIGWADALPEFGGW